MKLKEINNTIFESIKHIDEEGNEYWLARELQKVLEYKEWRKLNKVIDKAIEACKNSKIDTNIQFVQSDKLSIEDSPTPEKSLKELEKYNDSKVIK
jgi:DNA-damage-inducible protein D